MPGKLSDANRTKSAKQLVYRQYDTLERAVQQLVNVDSVVVLLVVPVVPEDLRQLLEVGSVVGADRRARSIQTKMSMFTS